MECSWLCERERMHRKEWRTGGVSVVKEPGCERKERNQAMTRERTELRAGLCVYSCFPGYALMGMFSLLFNFFVLIYFFIYFSRDVQSRERGRHLSVASHVCPNCG